MAKFRCSGAALVVMVAKTAHQGSSRTSRSARPSARRLKGRGFLGRQDIASEDDQIGLFQVQHLRHQDLGVLVLFATVFKMEIS